MVNSFSDLRKKLEISVGMLFKCDSFLLENGANERSVSHKLAVYIEAQLPPSWDVDCEYNLKGTDKKILDGIKECSEEKKTDRIFPDIIIHKRNTDYNLLVIETKTGNSNIRCDIKKLKLLTTGIGKYHYRFGLFIKFNGLSKPVYRWFENGQEKTN